MPDVVVPHLGLEKRGYVGLGSVAGALSSGCGRAQANKDWSASGPTAARSSGIRLLLEGGSSRGRSGIRLRLEGGSRRGRRRPRGRGRPRVPICAARGVQSSAQIFGELARPPASGLACG